MPGLDYHGTLTVVNLNNNARYTIYYLTSLTDSGINRRCYYCNGLGYRVKHVVNIVKIEKTEGYEGEIQLTSWLGKKLVRIARRRLLHGRVHCEDCDCGTLPNDADVRFDR